MFERPTLIAALTAVAICAVARVGLDTEAVRNLPGAIDERALNRAQDRLTKRRESTEVVVLGSSRMRDAIDPEVLAKALELPPKRVVKAAISGGTAFEALVMMRRDETLFRNTKVALVDIGCWQFNDNLTIVRHPLFYRHATLAERWSLSDLPERAKSIADWFWPYVSERRRLADWANAIAPFSPPTEEPEVEGALDRGAAAWDAVAMAKAFTKDYVFSDRMAAAWRSFVGELTARGVRMLIVDMPAQEAHQDWIDANASGVCQEYERFLSSLSISGVTVVRYLRPADVGLTDGDFGDYAHLSPEGAEKFSKFVATQIAKTN